MCKGPVAAACSGLLRKNRKTEMVRVEPVQTQVYNVSQKAKVDIVANY